MADILPGDLVVTYQDAFSYFDTENTGIIKTKSLGPLLRHCGENPSEAEVQVRIEKEYKLLKGKAVYSRPS